MSSPVKPRLTVPRVDDVRELVRQLAARESPREIARGSGVSHGTVYAFVADDSVLEPTRATLDKLERYAMARPVPPSPAQTSGGSPPVVEPPAGAHAPSYWQGELNASLRSLRAIQDLAGAVAATIQGTLASGALGGAAPMPTTAAIRPPQHEIDEAAAEAEAGAEAIRQRERARRRPRAG